MEDSLAPASALNPAPYRPPSSAWMRGIPSSHERGAGTGRARRKRHALGEPRSLSSIPPQQHCGLYVDADRGRCDVDVVLRDSAVATAPCAPGRTGDTCDASPERDAPSVAGQNRQLAGRCTARPRLSRSLSASGTGAGLAAAAAALTSTGTGAAVERNQHASRLWRRPHTLRHTFAQKLLAKCAR